MGWQKATGYNARARAEAAVSRYKRVIGDGRSRPRFRVRSTWNVGGGCTRAPTGAARPRSTSASTSSTACWIWDARTTSASPEPERGRGRCARCPNPCNTVSRGCDAGCGTSSPTTTQPGSSPGTATAPRTKSAPSSKGLIDPAPPTYPWPPEQRSRLSQQPGALHIRSNPDFYTNGDHAMIWHERC